MMEARLKKPMEGHIAEHGEHLHIKNEESETDQPLDFSNKREAIPHSGLSKAEEDALRKLSHDSGISVTSAIDGGRDSPDQNISVTPSSNNSDVPKQLIGEPRVSIPGMNPLGFPSASVAGSMAAVAGMGMFSGMGPGFPNPFMSPGFNPMWHNQMAAAAMLQQQQEAARKVLQTSSSNGSSNNGKSAASRPFKQYPKDPLNFSLCSMPGLLPGAPGLFPNGMVPDATAIADAIKSHDQMFSAYKQQVLSQKAMEDAKKQSRKASLPTASLPSQVGLLREHSPPSSTPLVNGHSLHHSPQPLNTNENSTSSFVDDDKHSVTSGKSSINGDTPQLSNTSNEENGACSNGHNTSVTPAPDSNTLIPKRKNGITAGIPPTSTAINESFADSPNSPISSTTSNDPSNPYYNTASTGRKRSRTLPDDQKVGQSSKDNAYWERRRKNNEAAKRSRDTRRAKEDEIAIRAAFLEQENLRLRVELAALRQQTAKLRSELVMYQSPDNQRREKGPADGS